MGAEVAGVANSIPTVPSLYKGASVDEDVTTYWVDIRDGDGIMDVVRSFSPEVIFHLAAQPLVSRSLEDPKGTFETNVIGTINVLEAVRLAPGTKVLVNVTSDKCYKVQDLGRGYVESDSMGGLDPYSSSKGCSELATAAYRHSFFMTEGTCAVASARAGNVIGGGDWSDDRLVPDLVRARSSGKTLIVRNPQAIRPWQHVLCPLSGYLLLAQGLWNNYELRDGWNFGPNDEDTLSVNSLLEMFKDRWKDLGEWSYDSNFSFRETEELRLDSTNAREILGWRPPWGLAQGVDAVASWYEQYQQNGGMRAITIKQIYDYVDQM